MISLIKVSDVLKALPAIINKLDQCHFYYDDFKLIDEETGELYPFPETEYLKLSEIEILLSSLIDKYPYIRYFIDGLVVLYLNKSNTLNDITPTYTKLLINLTIRRKELDDEFNQGFRSIHQ